MNLVPSRSGQFRLRSAALGRTGWKSVRTSVWSTWGTVGLLASGLYLCRAVFPALQRFGHRQRHLSGNGRPECEKVDHGVVDALPVHLCILDDTGTILSVNDAWRRFAETNPPVHTNVCEGANYLRVCDAARDDPIAQEFGAALRGLIAGELPQYTLDYPCHAPTEERWFTVRAGRYLSDGEIRIVVAHEPITERKLAQRALGHSEDRYRLIIEQALDGVFAIAPTGHFILVNDAACNLTGYSREELIGMSVGQLISPEEHLRFAATWERLMSGQAEQSEWPVIRKNGSRVITEIRARMQRDGNVVGLCRDLSEHKQAEALRVERDAAEAANRAKDQFLAMLSHELRTPLAPVLMATHIIEEDESLPEHVRELAATIHRNIELQARLIDDLLDQTRIARGKLELHTKVLSANEVIGHVLEILDNDIASKQLHIRTELNATDLYIRGDEARLQQILWNVLKNAVKFTPPEQSITIRTSNPAPHRIRIEISDTGIGIEPDLLPRIFRPFEQGNAKVTRRLDGLGLGLAISAKLAELHNGTLTAQSEGIGHGATFTLELPTEAIVPNKVPAEASPPKKPTGPQRVHVLLVEDHPDTARVLARLLERHGYRVHISPTLHDAEAAVKAEPFDIVLSDIDLPDGNGYQLMEYLREAHPVPSIAMSGFGMEDDVRRSLDAGFDEHLVKPVDPSRLEEAIEHLLARKA